MTKKSRYFLAGSAVVLLLGLGAGTMAYLAYHRAAGVPAGLPAELRYVPADAQLVAYADVKAVMASDMRKELERMTTGRRGQQQMHEFAGIDFEKDINHVVAYLQIEATPPAGDQNQGPPRVLLLAQGTFDQARVEQFMKEHGGVVEDYHGKHLVIRQAPPAPPMAPQAPEPPKPPSSEKVPSPKPAVPGNQPDIQPPTTQLRMRPAPEMAIGFVQPDVIALGVTDLVRQALDAPPATANITTNNDFMGLIRDESTASAWVVGQFDAVSRRMGLPAAVRAQVPPLRMVAASARIDGGVKATLKAQTADQAAADQLRDVVRGALAFARLQNSATPPQLQQALKTVELAGTGTSVQLSFMVTPEMLQGLTPPRPPSPPQDGPPPPSR
jgi:hypothetical protein